ncbi:MAG: cisplatin damage response ATP-dependent DNA ligase [Bauldia sp.]|nr:cisplatin damage response ATP-dependent DNA ligase [Bauldia sp.]MCW5717685.1 cisplatin damage response ATP-dependent DNA ligase [Bauldia sp.]
MKRFASLLDRLVLTPQRNAKLRLMRDYFAETPDPDRGYALAALTGDLAIASVKPATLRALIGERLDGVLFYYSYDYVGDLAETIALAWPEPGTADVAPPLAAPLPKPAGAGRSRGYPKDRDKARLADVATTLSLPFDDLPEARPSRGNARTLPQPDASRGVLSPLVGEEEGGGLASMSEDGAAGFLDAGALGSAVGADDPFAWVASAAEPATPTHAHGWRATPGVGHNAPPLTLADVVETLQRTSKLEAPRVMAAWLDQLDATGRWGLIKLVGGALRVGVSARLAKQALADLGGREVNEIEEVWHGVVPPYRSLFAWLEGRGERPESRIRAPFRPVMLSHAIADSEVAAITPDAYAAEWKWDGIRVQAVVEGLAKRLYSRTGEDISAGFPDLVQSFDFQGAIDGELLVGGHSIEGFQLGSFGDLQQRLNRKVVTEQMVRRYPAFLRAYDALVIDGEDLRRLPFRARRERLEALVAGSRSQRMDVSPLVPFADTGDLTRLRSSPPDAVIEGLMLKRWDSAYEPGRPKGPWFKWKRDPHVVDAVLMYAQRGHGKRSSFYSDYTFGVWTDGETGPELVPVGKAYFGFTDEELTEIDRFVRNNTVGRFGPVREVVHQPDAGLVFEVAFEGLNRSTRHRSGVAMRFPRISRLRWDKPPGEADRLETLEALLRG